MRPSLPRTTLVLRLALWTVLVPCFASVAHGHTVETTSGQTYEGKVVLENDEIVVIVTTFDGRKTIARSDVKRVDKVVPPLRDQLAYRAEQVKDDTDALWRLHKWAKGLGFVKELEYILARILELEPKSARAHKLLGHVKVDGRWMTTEEQERLERERHEAEMRAQGLVPHEGRWVTPEEKDALERGLIKDGDDWVTEDEYHRRRGEQLVDGAWVRVGEKEGKAWAKALASGRVKANYRWSPHFDLFHDVDGEIASRVAEQAEKAWGVMRRTLEPGDKDMPQGVDGRLRLHVFAKLPAYARFAIFFDKQVKCSEIVAGWVRAAQRQHSFWWIQPIGTVGAYKFPNTTRTVVSNVVHNAGMILLTQYRFNYRFPKEWLREGFAYYLEIEAMGYSDTFSISRSGSQAAQQGGKPVWIDSDKWRGALKALVAEGRDPPMKRIARMTADQMRYEELVKSWSVVEYLIRLGPERFRAFIQADKDRENTTEDALKKAYGLTWRQLDRDWRAYVGADFRAP